MTDPAKLLRDSAAVLQETARTQAGQVRTIGLVIANALQAGNKILFCGNGGSAADAQHLAAELLVRLRPTVNRRPFAAIALAMDSSTLTACGNDYGFGVHFARMVQALGQAGDVLVGLSTSGGSPNVVAALIAARALGLVTIGLLGHEGGAALPYCDYAIQVPSMITGRTQEAHIAVGHAMLEVAEDAILEANAAA